MRVHVYVHRLEGGGGGLQVYVHRLGGIGGGGVKVYVHSLGVWVRGAGLCLPTWGVCGGGGQVYVHQRQTIFG